MIIFVHKVRCNPQDGWGRSQGIQIDVLGRYADKEKALAHKKERDGDKDSRYCDVGQSWIEEELVE